MRYDYTIDESAHVGLAQSERILLHALQLGKYHVLQLTVSDDKVKLIELSKSQ